MTPTYVSFSRGVQSIKVRTSIGVGGEVASPSDEGLTLVLAGGNGVCADGRDNGGVAQLGLSRDNRVGNVVVDAL